MGLALTRGHKTKDQFRPEIQALRALAVSLVVVYHLWPTRIEGGYVGVDVFLVISGYLITMHLLKGFAESPRLRLSDFYSARIRRLLPASLFVLAVVGISTFVLLPQTLWGTVGRQVLASAFYVQNWVLAADSVDYLAAGAGASPVQHYWSLSVEEQFYLVWPLFLISLLWIVKRLGGSRRLTVSLGVATATVVSFAVSLISTASSPQDAYFVTPTRIWEFGVGALLAICMTRQVGSKPFRSALSWVGVVGVLASAVIYTGSTPFPGYAALLPVLSTAAVIAAGSVDTAWAPTRLFSLRPVQFLGDISYSLYLWHWPLIVIVPIAVSGIGSTLTSAAKVGIIVASVVLAWTTKVQIEDRYRRRPERSRRRVSGGPRSRTVLASALAGMMLVGLVGGSAAAVSHSRVAEATAELAEFESGPTECRGARALDPSEAIICGSTQSQTVFPDPLIASASAADQGCQQRVTRAAVISCMYGNSGKLKVAMVGDSHANQWFPAVAKIAEDKGWTLTTYFKSGCAFNMAPSGHKSCAEWNSSVRLSLADGGFDVIITSNVATTDYVGGYTAGVEGFRRTWQGLNDGGAKIIAIADTPRASSAGVADPPSCVEAKGVDGCSFDRAEALSSDPQKEAAEDMDLVDYLDMNDLFCIESKCPAVAGSVLVYRDGNHMTTTYARSLTTYLQKRMSFAGIRN
ncbi:acyltransferase 3 [Arthrobacter sp. FB24]|uniref:acyltransferase family protein n=1 Tax=Arthrobacter sp. (strain FB24) TaxID=290399 RepID=UPI00005271EF|nr:acyltransferase family protein [Arthrobacter sp. FB24]ABK04567.1 acyltransferase 3 [Arthrobacter sp. FB24]